MKLLGLSVAIFCCLPPDRPAPQELPKETPIPQIAGPSNYGDITQHFRQVAIDGHPNWYAGKGEVSEQTGKLRLEWVQRSTGRPAIGLYDLTDGGIIGHWGWVGDVFIDKGIMYGPQSSETLRAKKVAAATD